MARLICLRHKGFTAHCLTCIIAQHANACDPQTVLNRAHFYIRDSYHKGERGSRAQGTAWEAYDAALRIIENALSTFKVRA